MEMLRIPILEHLKDFPEKLKKKRWNFVDLLVKISVKFLKELSSGNSGRTPGEAYLQKLIIHYLEKNLEKLKGEILREFSKKLLKS